jgi:phage terminase small subunit
MSLTPKQAAFVREYLVDLNATQAAIRAGYSAKTAASIGDENLRKPAIAAAIKEAMDKRARRTEVTADRVVQELAKIGFSDIRRLVSWETLTIDPDFAEDVDVTKEDQAHGGALQRARRHTLVHLVGSDELDEDSAASVAEISQTAHGVKVKLHDKRAALVDLGRHLGLFKPLKLEVAGPDGGDPFAALMELIAVGGRPRPGN